MAYPCDSCGKKIKIAYVVGDNMLCEECAREMVNEGD